MVRRLIVIFIYIFLSAYARGQDFSNKGREFWVGYGYHQAMADPSNLQDMVLYFTSDVSATVKVEIPGVGWAKTYQVVANTVTESDPMPKSGTQDARLSVEKLYNTGIHITSDNPIVAYAHIYSSSNSAASLLFPVNTLGEEYYSLNFTQKANTFASNSWAFVVATEDNTTVEITPSANTLQHAAGQLFTITLNKGQIYNIMGTTSGNNGVDLTGTKIRSVGTGIEGCKRIAVYSGSGRVSINCENAVTSSDNLFQQVFPQNACGKRFLTVPTLHLPNNYFRIAVSDPATVVSVDGVRLTNLANGFYYEITANTPKSIVSDKPVMVAQYITSGNDDITAPCGNSFNNNGDPEMIYLSPLEQTIDKITLNSTNHFEISSHYINVVIKASAVKSFTLDGKDSSAAFKTHPSDPAYSYATFSVQQGSHSLQADSGFSAIAYGYGIKESYGYNAGTNIKNLNEFITIQNPYAISSNTCSNTPFLLSVTLPYQPTSLLWDFGNNPNLTPSQNVASANPAPDSTYISDGRTLYVFKLKTSYTFNAVGNLPVKIIANNQTSEGCSGQQVINYEIRIVAAPTTDFAYNHVGCASDSTRFTDQSKGNGSAIVKWKWDFGDAAVDTSRNPGKIYQKAGSYNVKLTSINDVGCPGFITKAVALAPDPVANFSSSLQTCVNNAVTFTDSSVVAGANISKWHWNFGNGDSVTNTTNVPVNKIYSSAGEYSVSLQVENNEGCRSNISVKGLTIHPQPIVNFELPGNICLPAGVAQFNNLSAISDDTDSSLSYLWNFGDGETSTTKNPSHIYKAVGSPEVTLKATSIFGCSKDSAKIFSNIYAQPHAGFTTSSIDFCVFDSVFFTDISKASNSSIKTWVWNFGDSSTSNVQNPVKKYATSGSYIVTLYTISAAGCVSDTIQKTININSAPTAAFTVSPTVCENTPITINDMSVSDSGIIDSRSWIFGDGTTGDYQNDSRLVKSYEDAGEYTIKLTVQSDKGCKSDTVQQKLRVVSAPVSNFGLPKICVNDDFAAFFDSSYIPGDATGALTYLWNFGDQNSSEFANSSTLQNPKHHFSAPGAYNISLTTTSNAGCSSTITKQFFVNGIPQANFKVIDSAGLCSNAQVRIQNNSTVNPGMINRIEVTWDVVNAPGDISVDVDPSPGKIYTHTYPTVQGNQTYKVRLRAFSGINCFDEKVLSIMVHPAPKVLFSTLPGVCLNDSAFMITQAKETTGVAGSFSFTGNGVLPGGIFSPSQAGAGESKILFAYTSVDGCRDSAFQTATVTANPTVKLSAKVFVLEGGAVMLQPVVTGNVTHFAWTPATWLDNANIQTPRTTAREDITYRLTVNSSGCTAYGDVKVVFLTAPIIPNTFSPNGDGINDVWNVPSLESFGNCTVQVFNRYGKLVFNSKGYQKPWNGSYNGSVLPVGVYYYVINIANGKKPYVGSLTILK